MNPKYQRYVIPSFGSVNNFKPEAIEPVKPEEDEVQILVTHIGINYADILARQGWYKWAGKPPICPGFEISGIIEETGKNTNLKKGDRVLGITKFNGYKETITLKEKRVKKIPEKMKLSEAAAIPAVYITAYHSLMEVMRIKKGEDILIQAVAGGVGTAALQIAKYYGLKTYGTASSIEKLEFAKKNGLDFGINYVDTDFEIELKKLTNGKGVNFVLDSIGGSTLRKGYDCLKKGGLVVTIGGAGLVPSGDGFFDIMGWIDSAMDLISGGVYHPFSMIEDNKGIAGVQILLLWEEIDYMEGIITEIFKLYDKGICVPFIDKILPLEEVSIAHEYIESRKSKGKILLKTRFSKE